MAVTYKDINLLTQKSTLTGTEKLPVSDTEFVTPNQIAALGSSPGTLNTTNTTAQTPAELESLEGTVNLHKVAKTGTYSDLIGTPTIDTALSVYSDNAISNSTIAKRVLIGGAMTATTVTGKLLLKNGNEYTLSTYNYNTYSVTPGEYYAFSTAFGTGVTSNTVYAVIWLDGNDSVVSYEANYANDHDAVKLFYDYIVIAPSGASKVAINYRTTYLWAGVMKHIAPPSPDCVLCTTQTFTSAEQTQARTNIGAAAAGDIPTNLSDLSDDATHRLVSDTEKSTWNGKQNAITVSSSEPTSSQGNDGDIWIVV